ncbi:MAG: uL22 family ribosomal protein [Nanoarchaeota archaeon]|nr:uL22 family ribosomal protein [Nanoarchaeota archaeon]
MAEEKNKQDMPSRNKFASEEKNKQNMTPLGELASKGEQLASEEGKLKNEEISKKESPVEKSEESKVPVKEESKPTQREKPKKTEAFAEGRNLPISTKHSMALCKFIKNKRLGDAIRELEEVPTQRRAIPMKGEIPHRKGKMMSGRFPKNASISFVKLLKSLSANAEHNGLGEPRVVEAIANMGSRPYGRFGRVRRKRTHVRIVAQDKIEGEKK